ncbi:MAG: S-adenosylmethionine:tRNA ribosyltransferase-isomerase [Paludibacteraceae bacterium]|nr:S-adenosylmethionine:tRNA ribosyltransferase-isomerase [Paludibacteraceae bacterium]
MCNYGYDLPDSRIAKYPLSERDSSKLLFYNKGAIATQTFKDLPTLLPKHSCLVFNNTKVIQARLQFFKQTGSRIEIFCLEPLVPSAYDLVFQQTATCTWKCMVGNLKKWKADALVKQVEIKGAPLCLQAERLQTNGNTSSIRFTWDREDCTFAEVLDAFGELPIPPYLNRDTEESDKTTYQTVYSKIKGSVAAPTAGLHFTDAVLNDVEKAGSKRCEVTLHVGAGTFQPVKSEQIGGHTMHTEVIEVKRDSIALLQQQLGSIVAVGTTSVRTIESLYYLGCRVASGNTEMVVEQWEPYQDAATLSAYDALQALLDYLDAQGASTLHASTRIIIVPGYTFKLVKALVTNFHQPHSTLLLLLAAFVGEDWRRIYQYALANDYRFLSYGDSSLLIP